MMTSETVGSINERGYLKGFKRRGYTEPKCFMELIANSLDSIDRTPTGNGIIRCEIGISEIRISDRGEGMGRAGLANMFDLHRENHASDASRGVSGIGAQPALSILSGDQNMYLLTYKKGGEYLKVVVPWADIHREGRYTGMVQVSPMTHDEVAAFGTTPGTTIVFPYSDALCTLIHDNFVRIDEDDNTLVAPLDRVGVVFGREMVRMEYVHHEEPDRVRLLPKYNYFAGTEAEFYTGVDRKIIEHWHSDTDGGKDRFICDNKEIVRAGRGWGKEPSEKNGTHGFRRVGEYEVIVGLRRDVAIFDEAHPVLPGAGSKEHYNEYNREHLGAGNKEYLALSKLVRNGQTIGLIPLPDMNFTTSRGDAYAHFKVELVQCEVRFNPVSAQNNRQDHVMSIQENKNQFDGNSLPPNFTRLVKAIRMQKAHEIWKYMDQRVAAAAPAPLPSLPHVPASLPLPSLPPTPIPSLPPAPAPTPAEESEDESDASVHTSTEELEPENEVPPPNGTDIRKRLTALVLKINSSIIYSPEIIAQLVALEELLLI